MKILNPKYETLNKFQISNLNVLNIGTLEFGACLGFRNSNLDITGGIDE